MSHKKLLNKIQGMGYNINSLLSIGSDSKTVKGEKLGYITGIVYVTPDVTLCPGSVAAKCMEGCLYSAGRAAIFAAIPAARMERTRLYKEKPELFYALLDYEIGKLQAKGRKLAMRVVVRLNGTSDIDHTDYIQSRPDVQFYDYSKRPNMLCKAQDIANYHVTLSYSAANKIYANAVIKHTLQYGGNMAVVFRNKDSIPDTFYGMPVINGDESDLRFLDPDNVVDALKAKGKAKKDTSGFVVDTLPDIIPGIQCGIIPAIQV